MMSFGKRLRKAREDKDLTQKELADLLYLGESTISFYESDKREPKFAILEKLADKLDVSVDWLLGRVKDYPIAARHDGLTDITKRISKLIDEQAERIIRERGPDKPKK